MSTYPSPLSFECTKTPSTVTSRYPVAVGVPSPVIFASGCLYTKEEEEEEEEEEERAFGSKFVSVKRNQLERKRNDALRQYRVLNGAELAPVPSSAAIHDVHDGRHYSGKEFRRREQRAMVIDDNYEDDARVYFGEKLVWGPPYFYKKNNHLLLHTYYV